MAAAVADRVWRPSSLARIEEDLTALWEELARQAPIARAAMSNLVVFCHCAAGAAIDPLSSPPNLPVDAVASHHPARVILLRHDPDVPAGAPTAAPDAHAGVVTFGTGEGRYGIEQIVIRSACAEAALPSIVRPLLRGDMPTTIWWTEDFAASSPVGSLLTLGRQLLYDSRRWHDVSSAVLAIAPLAADPFGPDLADVNWRRLTPVRQALLHAIESSGRERRWQPTAIEIRHHRAEPALAWLLAGWLQGAFDSPATVQPANDDRSGDAALLSLTFDDGLELTLGLRSVTVDDPVGAAPFTMSTPQETHAEALAAELRVLTQDVPLHEALAALADRFAGA